MDEVYLVGDRIGPEKPIFAMRVRGTGGLLRGGERPSDNPLVNVGAYGEAAVLQMLPGEDEVLLVKRDAESCRSVIMGEDGGRTPP